MIEIRRVTEFEPTADTLATDRAILPVALFSGRNPKEVCELADSQVQAHVEGAVAGIEWDQHGPAKYAEVKCLGLCYVYEIRVHGQPTEATAAVHAELEGGEG